MVYALYPLQPLAITCTNYIEADELVVRLNAIEKCHVEEDKRFCSVFIDCLSRCVRPPSIALALVSITLFSKDIGILPFHL